MVFGWYARRKLQTQIRQRCPNVWKSKRKICLDLPCGVYALKFRDWSAGEVNGQRSSAAKAQHHDWECSKWKSNDVPHKPRSCPLTTGQPIRRQNLELTDAGVIFVQIVTAAEAEANQGGGLGYATSISCCSPVRQDEWRSEAPNNKRKELGLGLGFWTEMGIEQAHSALTAHVGGEREIFRGWHDSDCPKDAAKPILAEPHKLKTTTGESSSRPRTTKELVLAFDWLALV